MGHISSEGSPFFIGYVPIWPNNGRYVAPIYGPYAGRSFHPANCVINMSRVAINSLIVLLVGEPKADKDRDQGLAAVVEERVMK